MAIHIGEFVAYYRLNKNETDIADQQKAVQDFLNGGNWKIIYEFVETEKGTRADRHRPALVEAVDSCRRNSATLVIAKMGNLLRNIPFAAKLLEGNVEFVACDVSDFDAPGANRLFLKQMLSFTIAERERHQKATQEGINRARKKGVQLGAKNPGATAGMGGEATQKAAKEFAEKVSPIIDQLRGQGAGTLQQIADGLEAKGVLTFRGNTNWSVSSVRNLLQRRINHGRKK